MIDYEKETEQLFRLIDAHIGYSYRIGLQAYIEKLKDDKKEWREKSMQKDATLDALRQILRGA